MTAMKTKLEDLDMVKAFSQPRQEGLTQAERNELTERFLGMSDEEKELFVDLIPVEMCVDRIQRELDKAKEFERSIKNAIGNY